MLDKESHLASAAHVDAHRFTSGEKLSDVAIRIFDYNDENFEERPLSCAEECFAYKDKNSITWIDVDGLEKPEIIEKIGTHYGLHPLVMEDIANVDQRPKVEEFDDYIFLVLKMLSFDIETNHIIIEHVSVIIGKNFVITFQEGAKGDVFDTIRQRIRHGKGKIRKLNSDFLAYSLIDMIVDNYFLILENIGDKIEDVEQEVMTKPDTSTLRQIYRLKREMMYIRKAIWPVREMVNSLFHSESGLIHKTTHIYLRDVYDHAIQIIDTIEMNRDMLAGMLDIYLSSVSYRMNAVMKVLTIISTIFIPLTFVTSIYGMNFEFLPELKWEYGYFMVWGIMLCISGMMIYYFKRMKWF
jgi:magnesium transporter